MDFFTMYSPSGVLLCKPCGYAVPPTTLNDARKAVTNSLAPSRTRKPAKLLDLLGQYKLLNRGAMLNLLTSRINMPKGGE
jgi:hypothetical protein